MFQIGQFIQTTIFNRLNSSFSKLFLLFTNVRNNMGRGGGDRE
jgi:hypothetical protein